MILELDWLGGDVAQAVAFQHVFSALWNRGRFPIPFLVCPGTIFHSMFVLHSASVECLPPAPAVSVIYSFFLFSWFVVQDHLHCTCICCIDKQNNCFYLLYINEQQQQIIFLAGSLQIPWRPTPRGHLSSLAWLQLSLRPSALSKDWRDQDVDKPSSVHLAF